MVALAAAAPPTKAPGPVPAVRLRPPRHTGQMSGVRHARGHTGMRRRLVNLLTLLSLLLCVAVVALWARSYGRSDLVRFDIGEGRTYVLAESARGRLQLGLARES